MLRLALAFPRGTAGLGLLVLRLVLAICLIADGASQAASTHGGAPGAVLIGALGFALMLCGALVAIGFLTPLTQSVVVVVALSIIGLRPWLAPLDVAAGSWRQQILEAGLAAGLALVGPGAYSVDARAFGRRELTVLPRRHQTRASGA
jgi:uncharacterized membrane protein YphA (DoxX/SURF4 family)